MENTILQTLRTVQNVLSEKNWMQGNFYGLKSFSDGSSNICMCIHGATKVVENNTHELALIGCYNKQLLSVNLSKLFNILTNFNINEPTFESIILAAEVGKTNISKYDGNAHLAWNDRPDWIKNRSSGTYEIHYLLGMAGLTVQFNDHWRTSFEMIQEKIQTAIALALALGV